MLLVSTSQNLSAVNARAPQSGHGRSHRGDSQGVVEEAEGTLRTYCLLSGLPAHPTGNDDACFRCHVLSTVTGVFWAHRKPWTEAWLSSCSDGNSS